jgi:RimJ/RimL family protein N-acetyltransferase
MTDNLRALRLYLRADIQVEGLRRQALDRRDGAMMDEYYMGRLIPHQ